MNYLSGPNVNTRVFVREVLENHSQETRCNDGSRNFFWWVGREKKERGRERFEDTLSSALKIEEPHAKKCRQPLEERYFQRKRILPPEGTWPCQHLDLRISDLKSCNIFVLFEATKLS